MKIKGIINYILIISVLAWCIHEFKTDIVKVSFTELWHSLDLVLIATSLAFTNYFFRICRWTYYLSLLGNKLDFSYSAITYIAGFAFTLSPGKVGEMVKGRYLQKKGVPVSHTLAAFFIERLLDLLAMVALACLSVGSTGYSNMMWGTFVVIIVIVLLLTVAPWSTISQYLEKIHWLPAKLNKLLQSIIRTFISSKVLLRPSALLLGFLIGLVAWAAEGLGFMEVARIYNTVNFDFTSAMSIYAIAIIVGALSFLPGGLGSTEAVMIAMLDAYGFTLPEAILVTFVSRLVLMWIGVSFGWLAVLYLKTKESHAIYIPVSENNARPLCVDLDGTLIHSDLLLETLLLLIKRNPLYVFKLPVWLLKGKAAFKSEIAQRVSLNPTALPYNAEFIDWLYTQKETGRSLWLSTASNYRLANAVAEHLQIFTGVIASSDTLNLSGRNKAKELVSKFGEKAFDYCGNHKVDLAIWKVSHGAIVVNGSEQLKENAEDVAEIAAVFPKNVSSIKAILKAMRVHQWAKNVLIFVPILAGHRFGNQLDFVYSGLAFLAFGFCASSVYLLNDMLDLEADRLHARKRKRPFASGKLSLLVGFALIPLLLTLTGIFASFLPFEFIEVLAFYYLLTVAYSFSLKSIVLIDTLTLAGLYTIRIAAGSAALDVPFTFWLLLFSVFLFLSLALVKRYAELDALQRQGKLKAAGRGYHIEDLPILHSLGTASGYLSVLVLALYINSPAVEGLYSHPQIIWILCILFLYWISIIWLKTHRGKMHDDPVVFALKDRTSLLIGVLATLTIFFAI